MVISQELRTILKKVHKLSNSDVNQNIVDEAVVQNTGLSHKKVYEYLSQLELLGLIKMLKPVDNTKARDVKTFRLLNITEMGLKELR